MPKPISPAGLVLLLVAGCNSMPRQTADLIFTGDNIITVSPVTATGVAIADGQIIAVGQQSDILRHRGPATRVVELGDNALLPGFIDAHGHFVSQALALTELNVAPPPVGPVASFDDLEAAIEAWITDRDLEPGEWLIASGYDDSLLAERRHPDRAVLDRAAPDNPVVVHHVSGHMLVASSRALDAAGISADTLAPPGGEIVHDTNGMPTGLLQETAQGLLRGLAPEPGDVEMRQLITAAQDYYAARGITTVQDGALSPKRAGTLEAVAASGDLYLDVVGFPYYLAYKPEEVEALDYGTYSGHFKYGGVKLMLDGSPQGKTAWLSKPYRVPPAGKDADYSGYPQFEQEKLDDIVNSLMGNSIPFLAHANGDAAAEQLLNAAEKGMSSHPGDHRPVMIHAQTVREDQLDRMGAVGMIPSYFAAHTFYWGDWHRDSVLGPIRASRISPVGSTLDRDLPFTVHNDSPIVPPDMLRLLWATVTRETRTGFTLGPDQRISVLDAIKAMTLHAAYQNFEESKKGSIEPGKVADLVILSENPVTVPAARILDIEVMETLVSGETRYRRTFPASR